MKTGRLYWGIFFITFGGLFLLNNFTPLKMDWEFIWTLWPVILIVLGAYFLIKESKYRWILITLSAFVLGFVLFAVIMNVTGFVRDNVEDGEYHVEYFREDYSDNISRAKLYVEAAAGRFEINDTSSYLFDAIAKGRFGNYYFQSDSADSTYDLSLEMEDENHINLGSINRNNVDIKLNTRPVWDIRLDVGASSVDLDLSPYAVQSLDVQSGAAKVKVKIGNKSEFTKVNFESGVSKLELLIPASTGCQINADTDLSKKNFNGFEKIDSHTYQTSNFNSAVNKAIIDLETAVSSVKVSRY